MGWPSSSSSSTVASWALLSWTRWTRMVHLLLLEQNIRSSQEYHMPVSGTSVHIINEAIEEREFANHHHSPSFSRYRMARGSQENTFSGSGMASASWRLSRAAGARLESASTTYDGWISSRCRSNCRAFSRLRRALPRCFLVVSLSSWICARPQAPFELPAFALTVSALRMALASHSTSSLPHEGRAVGFSHITAIDKEVNHADISAIVINLEFPARQPIEQA